MGMRCLFKDKDVVHKLKGKKVAIIEQSYTDCTFVIEALINSLHIQHIFSFYGNKEFYSHLDVKISTIFENDFSVQILQENMKNIIVIDDFHTYKNMYRKGFEEFPSISIFRSNSFDFKDSYEFDIIIEVNSLKSGFSSIYDGYIKIYDRDIVYLEEKYKN